MGLLYQRFGARKRLAIRELYPNNYAGPRDYPALGPPTHGAIEEFGVRCAQCRFPIKDTRSVKTCPNCGSDNFHGEVLTK